MASVLRFDDEHDHWKLRVIGAVSPAMQKAIRRSDSRLAGYWALELWHSGFGNYVWKRLLTVSAEDVWGLITSEIKALHDSYVFVNKTVPAKQPKGRVFISKAVILLSAARKSRDADHLRNFVYDALAGIDSDSRVERDRLRAAQPEGRRGLAPSTLPPSCSRPGRRQCPSMRSTATR